MKFVYFHRTSNNFKDIISDVVLKPHICIKISWDEFLLLGIHEEQKIDSLMSYVNLKYGDDIKNNLHQDFTPIPNKDYHIKK